MATNGSMDFRLSNEKLILYEELCWMCVVGKIGRKQAPNKRCIGSICVRKVSDFEEHVIGCHLKRIKQCFVTCLHVCNKNKLSPEPFTINQPGLWSLQLLSSLWAT